MSYKDFVSAGRKLKNPGPVKKERNYESMSTETLLHGLYTLHIYYHRTQEKPALERIYQITKIISTRCNLQPDQFTRTVKEYLF